MEAAKRIAEITNEISHLEFVSLNCTSVPLNLTLTLTLRLYLTTATLLSLSLSPKKKKKKLLLSPKIHTLSQSLSLSLSLSLWVSRSSLKVSEGAPNNTVSSALFHTFLIFVKIFFFSKCVMNFVHWSFMSLQCFGFWIDEVSLILWKLTLSVSLHRSVTETLYFSFI